MFRDAEQRQDDWFHPIVYDVCICGAGPAGITLARKLAAKGWSVGLFESGGLDLKPEAQELAAGKNIGLHYLPLDIVRLRGFGGTTGHWEGWTRPLDPYDFNPLPHHSLSGWPIQKSDLDPFADETAQILDLAPWETPEDIFNGASGALTPVNFRYSKPTTRFGEKYRDELAGSNIATYFNATLVDIELADSHGSVVNFLFRSYAREGTFVVRARYFVLCLGGIENARILLNSTRQVSTGIGNEHDLVGRYFCDHPIFRVGNVIFRSLPQPSARYAPSERMISDKACLNFMLGIDLAKPKSTTKEWLREALCTTSFSQRLASVVTGKSLRCFDAAVWVIIEQSLNRDSRILLGDEVDRFGVRRVHMNWQLSQLDHHTVRTAVLEFGQRLAETDIGRIQIAERYREPSEKFPALEDQEGAAYHHLCTTRMSDDAGTGVVNRNCRVHSCENLYIAGSSVFSTAGHAFPTYTITQLTLRLAEHLNARLQSS